MTSTQYRSPSRARTGPPRKAVIAPLVALALAAAFGVACSVLKGGYYPGLRNDVGNVSAPWLILPFLAGALAAPRRPVAGAAIGLATTLAALIGFYMSNAFLLNIGPHSSLYDITSTTTRFGGPWFFFGSFTGLGFGAAGAWLAGRRARGTIGAIVAVILILEPAAWGYWLAHHGEILGERAVSPIVATIEILCGAAVSLVIYVRHAGRH